MPACDEWNSVQDNLRVLKMAADLGLKAFVTDTRLRRAGQGGNADPAVLSAVVTDYSRNEGFAGYFLGDEPSAADFDGLSTFVERLRSLDPIHPAYINLFPIYANKAQLGGIEYLEYLDVFVSKVHPAILSYDHYALLKSGDRKNFYSNLQIVANQAKSAGLPFWQILLLIQHGPYRRPTASEKLWQAMQSLAYGAGGVLWFTYWTPGSRAFDSANGVIARNGDPTPEFAEVQSVNRKIAQIGSRLLPLRHLATLGSSDADDPTAADLRLRLLDSPSVTVGIFRGMSEKRNIDIALFANRSYTTETNVTVRLTLRTHGVEQFDKREDRWVYLVTDSSGEKVTNVTITLQPGDAEMLRW
jgi:hypothetical protein